MVVVVSLDGTVVWWFVLVVSTTGGYSLLLSKGVFGGVSHQAWSSV